MSFGVDEEGSAKSGTFVSSEVKNRVSRRTVVKGAAWSVPVIVAATAVPMAAASGALIVDLANPNSDCVRSGTPFTSPLSVTASDTSGAVSGASVTYQFASSNGGTITIGGNSYPSATSPAVVGVTDGAGVHQLGNITAGDFGTVTVTATVTTADGRTATTNATVLTSCATQVTVTELAPVPRGTREIITDSAGNVYWVGGWSGGSAANNRTVKKITPDGVVTDLLTIAPYGSLGLTLDESTGKLYVSHGWGDAGAGVIEYDIASGATREVMPNGEATYPYGVTLSPDGKYLYSNDYRDANGGLINRVDLATGAVTSVVTGLHAIVDIASDETGSGFYATQYNSPNAFGYIPVGGSFTPWRTFTGRIGYFDLDGNGNAYFLESGNTNSTLWKVDLQTKQFTAIHTGAPLPNIYTSGYGSTVTVIPGALDVYVGYQDGTPYALHRVSGVLDAVPTIFPR